MEHMLQGLLPTSVALLATVFIATIFYYYVYKKSPHSYRSITRNRAVATLLIWALQLSQSVGQLGRIDLSTSNLVTIMLIVLIQLVNLVSVFFLVCSVAELYRRLVKKQKKAMLWLPISIVIFYFVLKLITVILLVVATLVINSSLYSACGVRIESVNMNSPAAAAGMNANEIITRINNQPILNTVDLRNQLQAAGASEVEIVTNNASYTVQLEQINGTARLGIGISPALCRK